MTNANKKVAVFCGSKAGLNPVYMEKAFELGAFFQTQNWDLVYGGASIGIMGKIADSVISHGQKAIGVMPENLGNLEITHKNLSELFVVSDMHSRKKMMYDLADGFIIFPGGMGTLDEMFEILTWAQLKIHHKPCYLLNINSFYDAQLAHLARIYEEGFMSKEHFELLRPVNCIEDLGSMFHSMLENSAGLSL